MLRLFSIEYFKLKNTRYFWILCGLFILFLLSVPIAAKAFLDFLSAQGEMITGLGVLLNELPLFDFVDIWQNLTWVYRSFSILLGFIVVISVCSEYSYGTIKQNVIDGLSPRQFLWSKLSFILGISLVMSLVVMLIGLIMGLMWSPVKTLPFIVKNIAFIGAYFMHLLAFQLFCLVIALLIRRSGITLALLIFYVYVIEPIGTAILQYKYKLTLLADIFPIRAINNMIHFPFGKYALQETQTYVSIQDIVIWALYMALMYILADRLISKRDLG